MRRDFYDVMIDIIPQELGSFWTVQIPRYVGMSGLQLPYSKKELEGVFKWFIHEWVLEMENTNWVDIKQRSGDAGISKGLKHITENAGESGLYYVEKAFGYDQSYEERPKSKGEAYARELFEMFRRNDDEFFARMGEDLRASEFAKSKTTIKRFNNDIERWVRIHITRAGY